MDFSNISIPEKICRSTVRIEAILGDGSLSRGTSFIMSFANNPERQTHVPALVTNRHIIEGAVKLRFAMTVEDASGTIGKDWFEVETNNVAIENHPDVDLCAIPIATFHHIEESKGKNSFMYPWK